MIILNGVDGSGKTTVSKIIQEKNKIQYLHYYSFVYAKKIDDNNQNNKGIKVRNNFYISFLKEIVFAMYKLGFLVFLAKRNVIIDRTFVDVYIDLNERFGYRYILGSFLLFERMFRFFRFNKDIFIYLYVDNYKIISQRKKDENIKSAQNKFDAYRRLENFFENSIKINATRMPPDAVANKIYVKSCE